jgi:hypothetical protein
MYFLFSLKKESTKEKSRSRVPLLLKCCGWAGAVVAATLPMLPCGGLFVASDEFGINLLSLKSGAVGRKKSVAV